ncbi:MULTISPECIES: FAD binding domain-containing protein [unclassified Pedobacter]|uniref:FAD binding domain-containing protein n=1 Tax=unclassified Pedobacter TaxID=2628915 RepID=UPI001421D5CB|nr:MULTISPECIES: xanthine dehydrogenase family protein subunit M [unclassified Pedobacter]NII82806.1 xanthine dehydrogenase YagS FAD-binding subunit [Pedobacter sp. SG908]NMN36824.1 xanthine dehydrogenase YagS FAD-binding subunit [Pedobacter sp. SG918]
MINFQYLRTTTAKSAIALLAKDKNAKFLAGGTNLIDLMKRGVTAPEKLIDINHVPLKQIEQIGNKIHIGALASNSAVADHPLIKEKLPLLSWALQAGASAQLRNVATVGGNMMQRTRCGYFYDIEMPCNKRQPGTGCGAMEGFNRMHAIFGTSEKCIAVHPSDMCVALVALDAEVVLAHAKGERKISFKDFHRLAGDTPQLDNNLKVDEMIIRLEIPINNLTKNYHYLKVRDRASYAFALVSVAAAFEIVNNKIIDVRLAMGGVAHKPWRLTASENFLKGKEAILTNFEQAAQLAMKDAKGFGGNDFKLKLAPNTIIEALNLAKSKA